MSDSHAGLRHKIASAGDLQSVVRTMKALAAASIGQYERAVVALADYDHSLGLGLGEFLRQAGSAPVHPESAATDEADGVAAIVFGSDQGLVGQFNEVIADYAIQTLSGLSGLSGTPRIWAVGERVYARLAGSGLAMLGLYAVPGSVESIARLVGQMQIDSEAQRSRGGPSRLHVFHNRPIAGSGYEPSGRQLLPFDAAWQQRLVAVPWPGKSLPEVMGAGVETLHALLGEYLFISLFRACAESLASENASRLAAMERADRNILDLLETLRGEFRRRRQNSIDEELFDVTAGYEALGRSFGNARTGT
ncbi:MAG: F0F1 ATP synthase subunit gamma [Gammaproteobacteria bacterium]